MKLLKEVKEKINLPIVRDKNGLIIPTKFSQRERELGIEILNRNSIRKNGGKLAEGTHIFPHEMKIKKENK